MTAASLPAELRPSLGRLVRALATGDDSDVLVAARALDPGALAAFLYPAEPIIVPSAKSGRASTKKVVSAGERTADKLMRLTVNPRVDLTKWEKDFIDGNVPSLRLGIELSVSQQNTVERLLKKPRRRLK